MAASDCLFCKIASGQIPADVVSQDPDVLAFRDINPKAPTHILLIPRRHIASVNDLDAADAQIVGKLFLMAKAVAAGEGLDRRGYRLVMNAGPDAGQSVDHVHVHLLGGRRLGWPPG